MKKKLTLLIFFFPMLVMAQTQIKNGSIIIDLGGKKKPADTTQEQPDNPYQSDEDYAKQNAKKPKEKSNSEQATSVREYWRQHGLFQPIFHAGMNACQVDGDGYSGYNYLGAEFGVGAKIQVHPLLWMSMEINYSMKGAREGHQYDSSLAQSTTYTSTLQDYQVQFDYIQIPIALNINAVNLKKGKQQLMYLSFGLAPGILTRFKETDEDGDNVTSAPPEGQPRRFDLSAFGGLYFVIHKNFVLGGQFSYSITRIRGPYIGGLGLTRLLGEYNNDLTIDFKYILDTAKKGGKKIRGS